jgi:hypothetical protein
MNISNNQCHCEPPFLRGEAIPSHQCHRERTFFVSVAVS